MIALYPSPKNLYLLLIDELTQLSICLCLGHVLELSCSNQYTDKVRLSHQRYRIVKRGPIDGPGLPRT